MYVSLNVFPIQKLPISEKNEEWRQANVCHIIGRRNSNYIDKQNRKDVIQTAYDLYDSVFNERDFESVTNPYKVEDGFPASPQNFNIIRPKVDLLIGEESKKPFNWNIVQTSDDAVSMLQEKKKELLLEYVNTEIQNQVQGGASEQSAQLSLKEIEDYVTKQYKSVPEKIADTTLKYLSEKLNIKQEFLRSWKDALITGEEIYYTGIHNGDVIFERVNPLYCDFDKRPDLIFIEEGDWFLRHFRMSPASIYDRFFDLMDEEQLDKLLTMADANYTTAGGSVINWNAPITFSVNNIKEILLDVFHTVWKSYKKIGYLTYLDENGSLQTTVVDETYKVQDGEEIEWDWIIEIWEGYKVGNDLYIGIKPLDYQSVSIDNPNAKKLPYSGAIHGKSLVQLMKPLQYMYIIVWYRLELALARDKGKIINMDITQIPKSMNVDVDKWMHILSSIGVNFFNPYEEGWDIPGREGGKGSQFNQFGMVDLSMSDVIAGYINLMAKIEDMIGEISGVSKQRQGQVSSSELVGNVERSVIQSSHITEPWFWTHNQAKRNAITNLLNAAKHAWATNPNKKLHYIMDDATRIFLDINEDFLYADYDIFISDSTKDAQNMQSLKTLLNPALQAGASLYEAAEIVTGDNISKLKEQLGKIDAKRQQAEQAQQEQQSQIQQMKIQSQKEMHAEEMAIRREDIELKSNTSLQVAMIAAESKQMDMDVDNDGINDQVELTKLELERQKLMHIMTKDGANFAIKRKTLDATIEKQRSDARLKEKEIEVKRIAANKPKAASK